MDIFASPRFQEVVIHDLRTPLNVISLALRMVDAAGVAKSPELAEDLAMIRSNAAELERMLVYLVDASRLPASREMLSVAAFDPRELMAEVIEEHRARPNAGRVEVVYEDSPREVALDLARARLAVQRALANALAAAGGSEVLIRVVGAGDRLVIRMELRIPPRESVRSHEVAPEQFQRIVATPGERRGLDLAIAGRISELFGGQARLEATPGQGTAIVLDWPVALAAS